MIGQACENRVVTTGKDLVNYIIENGLEEAIVEVGAQGYVSDPNEEVVVGYDGNFLLIFDSCYYEGYCD